MAAVAMLEVKTALCDVAAAMEKEVEIVRKKHKGSSKGGGREVFDGKATDAGKSSCIT